MSESSSETVGRIGALAAIVATSFGAILYAPSVLITESAGGAVFSTKILSVAFGVTWLLSGVLAYPVGRRCGPP